MPGDGFQWLSVGFSFGMISNTFLPVDPHATSLVLRGRRNSFQAVRRTAFSEPTRTTGIYAAPRLPSINFPRQLVPHPHAEPTYAPHREYSLCPYFSLPPSRTIWAPESRKPMTSPTDNTNNKPTPLHQNFSSYTLHSVAARERVP